MIIEGDQTGYSAYVPELPAILVTGKTVKVLTERAGEAIRIYLEAPQQDRSATSVLREIEVEVPA